MHVGLNHKYIRIWINFRFRILWQLGGLSSVVAKGCPSSFQSFVSRSCHFVNCGFQWFVNYSISDIYYPTCARLSFERLSFDISKDSLSKDGPAQFGPIIELLDAIPDSALSSKQVVPHPSKHNLHKYHDLGSEPTVWTETWSTSIRIGPNNPKIAFPRSGDRPRDRQIRFIWGSGIGK